MVNATIQKVSISLHVFGVLYTCEMLTGNQAPCGLGLNTKLRVKNLCEANIAESASKSLEI